MKKGSYFLYIFLSKKKRIRIGKLGILNFKKGNYIYVGSALNNLEKRIARHKRNKKKLHWHIDYLLKHANIKRVKRFYSNKKIECKLARKIKGIPIKNFGCSDCKCISHLFYII